MSNEAHRRGSQPLVSVIVPTFNRLQYLPAAIESVFAQTLTQWELIVADDGSDAQTREYLKTLSSQPRVSVLWLPHTGNPGAVRNAALREAQGDYVAFLDSDDLWMPLKLQSQLALLQASSHRRWCYCEYISIDHTGASLDWRRNPRRVLHEGWIVGPLLKLTAGIAMPTVVVSRTLLEDAGGFDESQGLHEDYDLWLRLALASEVSVVRQPLAYVRAHGEHFSEGGAHNSRNFSARDRVFEKMQSRVTEPGLAEVLREARARNAGALAVALAAEGRPADMVRALQRSWRHSWRTPAWYRRVARAIARALAPDWLVSVVRGCRATMRDPHTRASR